MREGRALRLRARLLGCIGRAREAVATIAEAVRVLEQGQPGAELARAYSALAGMAMLDNDYERTITLGAKAIVIAEQVDDLEGLVHALNNVGTAELTGGNPAGEAKLERSLELARQTHLGTDAGRAYINLSSVLIIQWRWREALVWIERGIAYTRELGLEAWVKCLVSERALVELALGRWDDAATTAQALLDGPRDEIIEPRTHALLVVGLVRARRGDPDCWTRLGSASSTPTTSSSSAPCAPLAPRRRGWRGDRRRPAPRRRRPTTSLAG